MRDARHGAAFILAFLLLLLSGDPARAGGCDGPYLRPGLCDKEDRMVADPPINPSEWLDPPELVIADVPTIGAAIRAEIWTPFAKYLETIVGRPVTSVAVGDYQEQRTAFRENRIHIVNINNGNVESAVRCDGFVPIAQPFDVKGEILGYRMELIASANSDIRRPEDLKGHKIAFVDKGSNSGFKAPIAILKTEFGLVADRDYAYEFSGRHDASIMGVANGEFEAAAVASEVRANLTQRALIGQDSVRVIYQSKPFPNSPFGVSNRLNPALVEKIKRGFLTFDWNSLGQAAKAIYPAFGPADFRRDWAMMRQVSGASAAPPACEP